MPRASLGFLTRSLTPPQITLLTLWVLLMISFPFIDWMMGREAMQVAIVLGSLAQLTVVIWILMGAWGTAKTCYAIAVVVVLSWIAEVWGSHVGRPFGAYSYTEILQPQILAVPIYIPLGWMMMLPPSWAVAQAIVSRVTSRWQLPAFIGISALAMTAWDFLVDPMMVAWGIWAWDDPSGYYGIPWSNYIGWVLVAGLITAIVRPRDLPVAPLMLIYTITWLLETGGLALFWGLPGPALVGGVAMGVFSILGWRALINRSG